jgi:hypothetical protein
MFQPGVEKKVWHQNSDKIKLKIMLFPAAAPDQLLLNHSMSSI